MQVEVLSQTQQPQRCIWLAMHQCYSPTPALESKASYNEREYGELVVKHLLAGGRGHWSPLEQAHMSLNLQYVPLPIVVQYERHRLFSYSEQSLRYTTLNSSSVYLRRQGTYATRNGRYEVTEGLENERQAIVYNLLEFYEYQLSLGVDPEDARFLLPVGICKHLVMGGNLRAWLHLMDMRLKADAQLEARQLASLIHERLWQWVPQIMEYYDSRSHKQTLAP